MPLYKTAHGLTEHLGITKESCVCVAPGQFEPVVAFSQSNVSLVPSAFRHGHVMPSLSVTTHTAPACMDKYNGSVLGITAQKLIDGVHYVSAAAMSFARGLNDTPKIVGLLFVVNALNVQVSMLVVAIAMAIGG